MLIYEFRFDDLDEISVYEIVEFVQRRHNRQGWYFNAHFMNDILIVENRHLYVDCKCIDILTPYVDLLKQTPILCLKRSSGEDDNLNLEFFDTNLLLNNNILLSLLWLIWVNYDMQNRKVDYEGHTEDYFEEKDSEEIIKMCDPFKIVMSLFLSMHNYERIITDLNRFQGVIRSYENLSFNVDDANILQTFLDTDYFINKVDNLNLYINDNFMITEEIKEKI